MQEQGSRLPTLTPPQAGKANADVLEVKVVIVGAEGVGKSSIMIRYTEQLFEHLQLPTRIAQMAIRDIELGDLRVSLQIWDSPPFGRSTPTAASGVYRDARVFVLVFDLTRPETLDPLREFYDQISKQAGFNEDSFSCVVLGNKADLEALVDNQQIRQWQQSMAKRGAFIPYVAVSAKTGSGIPEAFLRAAAQAAGSDFSLLPKPPLREASCTVKLTRKLSLMSLSNVNVETVPLKVIVAGAPRVGKSSMIQTFHGNELQDLYTPTVIPDISLIDLALNGETIILQLWDVPGDSSSVSYFSHSQALVLVFDLTNNTSFEALDKYWSKFVENRAQEGGSNFPCLCVGSKADLVSNNSPATIPYVEVSAKSFQSVQDMLEELARLVYDYALDQDATTSIDLEDVKQLDEESPQPQSNESIYEQFPPLKPEDELWNGLPGILHLFVCCQPEELGVDPNDPAYDPVYDL